MHARNAVCAVQDTGVPGFFIVKIGSKDGFAYDCLVKKPRLASRGFSLSAELLELVNDAQGK